MNTTNKFPCYLCGLFYRNKITLRRHLTSIHSQPPAFKFKCTICAGLDKTQCFGKKSDILQHFKDNHEIEILSATSTFPSFQEFKEWKCKYEIENDTRYILLFGSENVNHTIGINKINRMYYKCHKSGHYKKEGKGIRKLKTKGSKKIDGYCPSEIRVIIGKDGKLTVTLISTHVGHENYLAHPTNVVHANDLADPTHVGHVNDLAHPTHVGHENDLAYPTHIEDENDLAHPAHEGHENDLAHVNITEKNMKDKLLQLKKDKVVYILDEIKGKIINSSCIEEVEAVEKMMLPFQEAFQANTSLSNKKRKTELQQKHSSHHTTVPENSILLTSTVNVQDDIMLDFIQEVTL